MNRTVLLTLIVVSVLGISVRRAAGDQCTQACQNAFRADLKNCQNSFGGANGNAVLLKACADGAKATLDACLLLCAPPTPENASIAPDGFLPDIDPAGAVYTIDVDVIDSQEVVDSIDFFLTQLEQDEATTSLLGTDTNGADGWSISFDPSNFTLDDDTAVIIHIEVLNASAELLVGDAAVAHVLQPIPTVSEWGLIVMTLLALTAGTIVFARRRRPAVA